MRRSLRGLILGLCLGLLLGGYLGAFAFPQASYRSAMSELAPSHRDAYSIMVAAGFAVDGDALAALDRLSHLGAGIDCVFLPTPFGFCLRCGISYARQRNDFVPLGTLNAEGRSSATTILSLSAIRALRGSQLFDASARKLLSFTDNRQDASLQAGHFNDFIELSLLRGAIYQAVKDAGAEGLRHERIARAVVNALGLPFEHYAVDPAAATSYARERIDDAFRHVLGYRIYRDLQRGWRINLPNLEQTGLLRIDYAGLGELCREESLWEGCHPALSSARAQTREAVARVLLDLLRRELAIKVEYLDRDRLDSIKQNSFQDLRAPWAIDENEELQSARIALPRSLKGGQRRGRFTYVSARGAFGQYLRRRGRFSDYGERIDIQATERIIRELLDGLRRGRLVELVKRPAQAGGAPGYQLVAAAMRWQVGDGKRYHDPLRMPNRPDEGGAPNPFFEEFYTSVAAKLRDYRAREHTAQVPATLRQRREEQFRSGQLPILYCSPTMELGVDIAQLNLVNMRNVPPTPANYAQRSGRAGRGGQPALVFTYCSGRSPHDQYFFKQPQKMVAGAVTPPRLDLHNRELLKAHLHSIWLAETGLDLRMSLTELLDMQEPSPSLDLNEYTRDSIKSVNAKMRARQRAAAVLRRVGGLKDPDKLLDETMQGLSLAFDRACDRWRGLYRAARDQADAQGRVIRDASRSASDKQEARNRRRDAEAQLTLLTDISKAVQSDFYSYRYFATEGFLPGYSFPRLPLSAFIRGRRLRDDGNFLSRPRFLAISEFGPRAYIYYEGSRYIISQVMMPVTGDEDGALTSQIKQCGSCGAIHPLKTEADYDICASCGQPLEERLHSLLRMRNVNTQRRERIMADEEERMRMGYELRSGLQFSQRDGQPDIQVATLSVNGRDIARLT